MITHNRRWLNLAALLIVALFSLPVSAADAVNTISNGMPAVTITQAPGGGQTWSLSIQVLLLMTALTLLPALLLTATAFTRIVIVLGLLRQALGTGQTPTNQVIIGLSLFLSFFVMQPVLDRCYQTGVAPYLEGSSSFQDAWKVGSQPLRQFMLAQTRDADLLMFSQLAKQKPYATPEEIPYSVLAASFLTSELKTAFEIGFMLFIPFIVIDLVISSVLMSMGMMMLSPMLISLPFKIMLFVLVDGWVLVLGSLAASFRGL